MLINASSKCVHYKIYDFGNIDRVDCNILNLNFVTVPKVLSEDAFVNPIKRGDLSSLSWVQSPLKYERHTGMSKMKITRSD